MPMQLILCFNRSESEDLQSGTSSSSEETAWEQTESDSSLAEDSSRSVSEVGELPDLPVSPGGEIEGSKPAMPTLGNRLLAM